MSENKNGTYTDCIVIDGENKSIKKEAILHIQEEFTKTALEQKGKKVYILNMAENATVEALNSLLKFLEEPSNDVTAILIVEQVDRLLPTIVSRCQMIPFKKNKLSDTLKAAKEKGLDELDAYLCAKLAGNIRDIETVFEDENYQSARYLALLTIEKFKDDPYEVLYEIQKEGFKEKKEMIEFSLQCLLKC